MFRRICLVAWALFSVGVCQADPQPIGAFIGTTELLEVNIQRSAKIDNNALVYDAATGKLILEAQTATAGAHAPTHQPNGSDTLSDTYTVTNRQVIAGTGMSGGGDLSADRTLTLADTAVTPGTYGGATVSAQIVIDQQGRATSASDVTITGVTPAAHQASHQSTGSDPLNATYTVTTRQVIAGTGMTGGGDLSADRTLTLADTAVTPGTYGGATVSAQIVIDQQGRVTSATDVAISAFSGDVGDTTQGELDNTADGYVHINDPLAVTGNTSVTGTLTVLSGSSTVLNVDANGRVDVDVLAQAGTGEVLLDYTVSDVAGYIQLLNNTTGDAGFSPWTISRPVGDASYNAGWKALITAAHDTGTTPAFRILGRQSDDATALTRPLIDFVSGSSTYASIGSATTDIFTITGGTLASTKSAQRIAATLPNTAADQRASQLIVSTTAGTGPTAIRGQFISLGANFTGATNTQALRLVNSVAGTAVAGLTGNGANEGASILADGVGAGHNVGITAGANGSSASNVGILAYGGHYGADGTNAVGVYGAADAGATNAVGVVAAIHGTDNLNTAGAISLQECALLADNRTVAADIAVFRDNGTEVLVVEDGGVLRVSPGGTDNLIVDTSNVSITQPIEYGGSETAGSVVLVAGTATVTHNLGMDSPTTSYLVYATPQADPGAVFNVVQRYNDFDIVATNDVRVNWMIIIN